MLAFCLTAGCVSIYDTKVQVQQPEGLDQWNRSVIEQCTPHPMPHRLILATANEGYPYLRTGPQVIGDQATFDQIWTGLSIVPDPSRPATEDLKPALDWTQQSVYLLPIIPNNSCQRVKPDSDEMSTDCQNVTIGIYTWTENGNCQQAPGAYPVFLYLYPKVNLPVYIQWVSPTPTLTATVAPTSTTTATPTVTPTPAEGDDE